MFFSHFFPNQIDTNRRDELIALFTDFRSNRRLYEGKRYIVKCCAGIAIDLLNAVARDLHFDYDLYMVADGLFGVKKDGKWDGIVADLVHDVAHLSFTAFSTTSSRVWVREEKDRKFCFTKSAIEAFALLSVYCEPVTFTLVLSRRD